MIDCHTNKNDPDKQGETSKHFSVKRSTYQHIDKIKSFEYSINASKLSKQLVQCISLAKTKANIYFER